MCADGNQENECCCGSSGHARHHHPSRCDCGEGMPRRFVRPFVLLLLAEGPSHGYELARSLKEFSSEGLNVEPSILYRMLRPVSYTHLRAHETRHDLVCRLLL